MEIHEVKCDGCQVRAAMKYNREHYLIPDKWVELHDPMNGNLDKHLCDGCLRLVLNRPQPAKDSK